MGVTKSVSLKLLVLVSNQFHEEGTKRLVRAAINMPLKKARKSVTLVHKGNIMKFTEGAFKKWGYEVAEQEFG